MIRSSNAPTTGATEPADAPNPALAEAAQAALAGEHAAVYGYGVAGAHLADDEREAAREALDAHRARRDALTAQIDTMGTEPVAALAAYVLPFPVTDATTARQLAGVIEQRLGPLYTDLVAAGSDPDVRALAALAVVDTAVRATRWTGTTSAFPGLDGRPGAPLPTPTPSTESTPSTTAPAP